MRKHLFKGFMKDSPYQTMVGKDKIKIGDNEIYGEWVYGYLANAQTIDEYEKHEIDGVVYEVFKRHCAVIPETVCEYIGLTDKNGIKIFEGAIMKSRISPYPYTVAFKNGGFIIRDKYENGIKTEQWAVDHLEGEIIGNIHDNPELLTEKGD